MKPKLNVGVIGAGFIAEHAHLPSLKKIKEVQVVAVCDIDRQRANHVAVRFGIPKVYSDYIEMLDREQLDVVHICTPPRLHATMAIQSMNRKCHVLVEKPMATSVKEAEEMVIASKKNNVKLCVCHNNVLKPSILKAKSLIDRGEAGRVTSIRVTWLNPPTQFPDWVYTLPLGGLFLEVAPHAVSIIQLFLKDVNDICTFSTDNEIKVLLKGDNVIGVIDMSFYSPTQKWELEIRGTERIIYADLLLNTVLKLRKGGSKPTIALDALYRSSLTIKGMVMESLRVMLGKRRGGHYDLIRSFIKSLMEDTDPPVTGDEGKRCIQLIELIHEKLNRETIRQL